MPQKTDPGPATLAELLGRIADKDRAFNFDVTLELNTPSLRVGSIRVHGRVESASSKKK